MVARKHFQLNRRDFVGGSAAAAALLGLGKPALAAGEEIVSTVFGGVWEEMYRKHIVGPYEAATGDKLLLKLGSSGEWLTNAMVNRESPEIDLLMLPYPDSIRATTAGLTLPLSADAIPNLKEVDPVWVEQYDNAGVCLDYVGYGIAYRSDLVGKEITSWKDLWDPALKDKVIIPQMGGWGSWEMLVITAIIHGGSEDDLDPAFAALKELKPNIRQFFKSGVDIVNLLDSGEAWVCGMTTNIAPYSLIDAGKPVEFVYPTEGAMVGAASLHIARNSQKVEACQRFIDFALSKEAQENFCNGVIAAPTNGSAEVSDKVRERVPSSDNLVLFDWAKIIPQMADLTERWNQEIAF